MMKAESSHNAIFKSSNGFKPDMGSNLYGLMWQEESNLPKYDVVVVGAGPAGLAAAIASKSCGAEVLVLERNEDVGGILKQCVHDGFGMHLYGRSLTGPEYISIWEQKAIDDGIDIRCGVNVLGISRRLNQNDLDIDRSNSARTVAGMNASDEADHGFIVNCIGEQVGGHRFIHARSVIVATGCRERTRGSLLIPGTRPSGVMTAGMAQYMINVKNLLPGDKVVILGSGDIGLITARRLALEGADVRLVLGSEGTGLLRNHIRCIRDFGIPYRIGWGIAKIHGHGQLKGVTIAPFDEQGNLNLKNKEYIRCNLLLLACGLVPEKDFLDDIGDDVSGVFVCGNANVVHDLVDEVTQEAIECGIKAARFSKKGETQITNKFDDVLRIKVYEPKGHVDEFADDESALVCSLCPSGCIMHVLKDGKLEGNSCDKGRKFAHDEIIEPKRTFTGTVRLLGAKSALLPVRTSCDIVLTSLPEIAKACRNIRIEAPVRIGDVLAQNICDSGADLLACASAEVCEESPIE